MSPDEERILIERCRRGDEAAWDSLFQEHYPAVGRFVFQLASDFTREDVEEVAQEVFLSAIRSVESFRGGSRIQTWLFKIASNKTKDYRDKLHAVKRGGGERPLPILEENPDTGAVIDPPASSRSPDSQALADEEMRMLYETLSEIGEPCREIIELRYFGDMSYDEIAAALEMNPKTVGSRLSKCLDKLEEVGRARMNRESLGRTAV
jgi:RNA polymerase sigma-70 factor (ECF subfamily)